MLEQGIIRPSESAWSTPIWIVPKKVNASGKTKWRLVVDFRKLNEKTVNDKYPIPNISDVLDSISLQEHMVNLEKVFQKLRESNFKILTYKYAYLGHIISKDGIKPNPSKISAIEKYPLPKTAKEIKQFLEEIHTNTPRSNENSV
ncbi:unnamed protein product [Parnassius mnemosyne]|uniref:Uncharacterized protein n=1 Tax=Parnassius mnemosyne TaxID=213953 RepID=A0AAV1M7F6_9NEOP